MDFVLGFQDTRTNGEDFAITPYLFSVYVNKTIKVFGIGLCWGWYSIYIGIGFNLPKKSKKILIRKYDNNIQRKKT
jgi:hypothetical protein